MDPAHVRARARVLRRRGRWVLIAFVATAASGCGRDPKLVPPTTVEPRVVNHIVLIGDSLLFQSATAVATALEKAGWKPTMRAVPGAPIIGQPLVDWRGQVRELVEQQRPAAVVVELGTNDCGKCDSIDDTIDDLMRVIAAEHVYWIGVREAAPVPGNPGEINDALRDAADRWPNLEFVALDGALDERRDIGPDHVHFSTDGQRVFAQLLVDAVGTPTR